MQYLLLKIKTHRFPYDIVIEVKSESGPIETRVILRDRYITSVCYQQ